jgi:hypothetical protein
MRPDFQMYSTLVKRPANIESSWIYTKSFLLKRLVLDTTHFRRPNRGQIAKNNPSAMEGQPLGQGITCWYTIPSGSMGPWINGLYKEEFVASLLSLSSETPLLFFCQPSYAIHIAYHWQKRIVSSWMEKPRFSVEAR